MNQDMFERSIDKLAGAQTAMLNTVAVFLGVIVSATAIIAAIGGSKSTLLFPTIIASFLGVACVLATFYQQNKELRTVFENVLKMSEMTHAQQLDLVTKKSGSSAASRLSKISLVVSLIASTLFLTLCAITFIPSCS